MNSFYINLLWAALIMIALLIFCCVLRAVKGPKVADRLVAINMMTTLVTIGICILTFVLSEGYLADVALIFSLLGCMAVIVLTRVFLSLAQKKFKEKGASARVE